MPKTVAQGRSNVQTEEAAFTALGDAVLELLDKSLPEFRLGAAGEGGALSGQIRNRAAEIAETLKVQVLDEIDKIKHTELGEILARKEELTAALAAERQKTATLQTQLKVLKESVDRLNKAHAEELTQKEQAFESRLEVEKEGWTRQHEAEMARRNLEVKQRPRHASGTGFQEQLASAEAALRRTMEEQLRLLRLQATAWQSQEAQGRSSFQATAGREAKCMPRVRLESTSPPKERLAIEEAPQGAQDKLQDKLDGLERHYTEMQAKRGRE